MDVKLNYETRTFHLETRAYLGQSLLGNSKHVHRLQLHCLEADHVDEALVEVGDVLLAPGHVLESQASGDVLGLLITQGVWETPSQSSVTLFHLKIDQSCLVCGGVHVEDSSATMGKLKI